MAEQSLLLVSGVVIPNTRKKKLKEFLKRCAAKLEVKLDESVKDSRKQGLFSFPVEAFNPRGHRIEIDLAACTLMMYHGSKIYKIGLKSVDGEICFQPSGDLLDILFDESFVIPDEHRYIIAREDMLELWSKDKQYLKVFGFFTKMLAT
ncbi:MAG: hypothetical protein OXR68_06540 [Alphaproteobacteria bacterium]|nr:hypothetical protein [Alphaproteobacteria bacterium]MDD9920261.1 hypothetical protein [Alphaproteobacteria bacterium]